MITETTTIQCQAVFSEDRKHRFLLQKIWNTEKPKATIIMINPNQADLIRTDATTMLVINNLDKLGFGSVDIVNLYSVITSKISFRFTPDEELLETENDAIVLESAKTSDQIIIAWGSVGVNSERVRKRQAELLTYLYPHQEKMVQIGNGCHPLAPAARSYWSLNQYREVYYADHTNNRTAE